jgi:hypothetical protein
MTMSSLTRFAGLLALIGGAVWVIANLIQIVVPSPLTSIGLLVSVLLIGGAALGLQRQIGARSGALGRWGAIASAFGSVGLTAVLLLLVATGQINTPSTQSSAILQVLFLLSGLLWVLGSVALALGLMRAEAISPIAGWLIVLGAVLGSVLLMADPQSASPIGFLPWLAYGAGWVLVGYAARTPATDPAVAARGT